MANVRISQRKAQELSALIWTEANKGAEAAAGKLATELRKTVSVPGVKGTKAIPKAPPRKITGNLYRSIKTGKVQERGRTVWRVNVSAFYGKFLERSKLHPHQFLAPTIKRCMIEMQRLIANKGKGASNKNRVM